MIRSARLPDLPGVVGASELRVSAEWIAGLQHADGMIPWFIGGHCDPWNHVETAMALDVMGLHSEARRAYEWLVSMQHAEGWWFNYYAFDHSVEEPKLDTNVCAYIATGLWHHWLVTGDLPFVRETWPTVRRALDWVLSMARPDGTILWARELDVRPWDYALLTGCSSIWHALGYGLLLADLVGDDVPAWAPARRRLGRMVREHPEAFEPKERWAMDWYYPVLAGVLTGEAAKARLAEGWDTFVMDGLGVRCVSDEPWITASETAECAIAYAAGGDTATASDLLRWIASHRQDDGSYLTGLVYPSRISFPDNEVSAYTAAAVILAADLITGATPASQIFAHR